MSKLLLIICRLIALSLGLLSLASCTSLQRRVQPRLEASTWTSDDGKQMPWRVWPVPAGTKERCVLITIHGLSGAMSDFWLLGERLPPQGVTVYGYELRGQGNDPDVKHRGDIADADRWLRDLLAFHELVRQRHPGTSIVWYGESLGSLIALHATAKHRPSAMPDALVLAAPVGGLRVHISELERLLLRSASFIAPGHRVKIGDIAGVDENKIRVTSTSTHGEGMAKTPHHVATFSLRLLREVDDLLQANPRSARRVEIPVLVLASPHDVVSSPDQVQTLFKDLRSEDKRLLWYSRSYHLLLHDVQREEVVADLLRWLNR